MAKWWVFITGRNGVNVIGYEAKEHQQKEDWFLGQVSKGTVNDFDLITASDPQEAVQIFRQRLKEVSQE